MAIAQKKLPKVEKLLEGRRKVKQEEELRIGLMCAAEQGQLDQEQLFAVFQDVLQLTGYTSVPVGLEFADGSILRSFGKGDVESMLSRDILPNRHGFEALQLVNNQDEECYVTTCVQWAKQRLAGFFPCTAYAIKQETFFANVYAVATAISIGQPAERSYLRGPYIDLSRLDLLPVDLLPRLSLDDSDDIARWAEQGLTLEEIILNGEAKLCQAGPRGIKFWFRNMYSHVVELLRTDLDADGTEDMLVKTYARSEGGTHGAGGIAVLSRLDSTSKLQYRNDISLFPAHNIEMQRPAKPLAADSER